MKRTIPLLLILTVSSLRAGVVVGDEHLLSDDRQVSSLESAAGPGEVMVCWTDLKRTTQVRAARVNAAGERLGPVLDVAPSTGVQYFPHIAFDGVHYLVLWMETPANFAWSGKILGRLLNIDGSPASDLITVSDSIGLQGFGAPITTPFNPTLAWNGSRYLVIWVRGDGNVGAVVMTPAGTVEREVSLPIRPRTIAAAGSFSAATNTAGETLVTWTWRSSDGATGIDAVVLNGDFVPGNVITIASDDSVSRVAAGVDAFFVIWENWNTREIRGIALDSNARPGSVVIIDPSPSSQEDQSPRLTFDGSGYVVAWYRGTFENSTYYSTGIFGARVSSNGVAERSFGLVPFSGPATTPSYVTLSAIQGGRLIAAYAGPNIFARPIDISVEARRRAVRAP